MLAPVEMRAGAASTARRMKCRAVEIRAPVSFSPPGRGVKLAVTPFERPCCPSSNQVPPMLSISLDDLNPAQRDAVLAPGGPILILAGAGSGKTRVLTYRIAHLLTEHEAPPERTLALTFTNKAAGEMRERVAAMMGESSRLPWMSTFHALCARVLRQEAQLLGYTRNFSILDESDSLATIRRLLEEAHLADSPPAEIVRARIDQAKNEAIAPEQLAAAASSARERTIAELYALY